MGGKYQVVAFQDTVSCCEHDVYSQLGELHNIAQVKIPYVQSKGTMPLVSSVSRSTNNQLNEWDGMLVHCVALPVAAKQASKQASTQAGRQASKQASKQVA